MHGHTYIHYIHTYMHAYIRKLGNKKNHSRFPERGGQKKFDKRSYRHISRRSYECVCVLWNNITVCVISPITQRKKIYRVILSVLDPRKCEYLKDYALHFEHAYMTTYLASWEACRYLFAALWHPDVIGTTTGVWRHVALSRVLVLCGSENLQRICGSTWWWRAPKRLFSAGWSHMPHLEWEHGRNRKLFWSPDYFENLMAAKISWLKSARCFPVGHLKRKSYANKPHSIQELENNIRREIAAISEDVFQTWSVAFSSVWTVVANISSISSSIDMLFMKQGM